MGDYILSIQSQDQYFDYSGLVSNISNTYHAHILFSITFFIVKGLIGTLKREIMVKGCTLDLIGVH